MCPLRAFCGHAFPKNKPLDKFSISGRPVRLAFWRISLWLKKNLRAAREKCENSLCSDLEANSHSLLLRAGDGTRTRDVQLGKLAFYH
jgi:hypothetical protein